MLELELGGGGYWGIIGEHCLIEHSFGAELTESRSCFIIIDVAKIVDIILHH